MTHKPAPGSLPYVLISLTEKKHFHNTPAHHAGAKIDTFFQDVRKMFGQSATQARTMSHGASAYWLARAKQMRALAEEMRGGISKLLMHRMADDYERFARRSNAGRTAWYQSRRSCPPR